MTEQPGRWRRWRDRARQPRPPTGDDAGFAGGQFGPLAFLGLLIGGIFGWLLSSGALPVPGWLPVTVGEPLRQAAIFAALGALVAGGIGLLADLTATVAAADDETTPPLKQR
jgi:hypothetical protein